MRFLSKDLCKKGNGSAKKNKRTRFIYSNLPRSASWRSVSGSETNQGLLSNELVTAVFVLCCDKTLIRGGTWSIKPSFNFYVQIRTAFCYHFFYDKRLQVRQIQFSTGQARQKNFKSRHRIQGIAMLGKLVRLLHMKHDSY